VAFITSIAESNFRYTQVEKFVLQLEAQLGDRNVSIELSEEASRWLIATATTN
jgi:hypothetical protein